MYHVISGEARFFLADDGDELSSDVTETWLLSDVLGFIKWSSCSEGQTAP